MIDADQTMGLLGFLALVLLNAIISAAHSALVNSRKQQLRNLGDEGNPAARSAISLSDNSTRLLASRRFMSVLLHFGAAGLLTATVALPISGRLVAAGTDPTLAHGLVFGLTWLLGVLVMLVFGELIPDVLASANPEQLAMTLAAPMRLLLMLTSPATRFMMWLSTWLARPFGNRNMSYVTEEEIKTLVDAGQEEGVIEDAEKEMIYSLFQFGDKVAREVMVPRIDMVALEAATPIRRAVEVSLDRGHSRLPVFEETVDKVVGILYARDLLKMLGSSQNLDRAVRDVMRPAYFVPEAKRAGDLLTELQQRRIHMAIVIDEYGGTAGLVTIEDLLEEIVGDIQDEYDPDEEAEYHQITDDEYLFDAGINLTDVNNLMEVELPTEDSDTLGGYVFSTLGKVPLVGETFRAGLLEIKVEVITGRRIRKVRVRRIPPPKPEADESDAKPEKADKAENKAEKPDRDRDKTDSQTAEKVSDRASSSVMAESPPVDDTGE
jgi:CBS domain containing-hemolysin-like protein